MGDVTDFDDYRREPRAGRHRAPESAYDDSYDGTAGDAYDDRPRRAGRDDRDYRGDRGYADEDFRDGYRDDHRGDYPDDDVDDGIPATDPDREGGGMPLRGLAMVLIFIGVCLMGWGLYAWTSSEDEVKPPTEETVEAGQGEGDPAQAPAGPRGEPAGRPDAEDPARAAGGADEGDAAEVDRGAFRVTVLNNSNVQGLAGGVSDELAAEGWGRGETGNAPESDVGVFERTTVVYTPGNAREQAAAEEIARDRGWAVAPRGENLRGKPGGILVIVTETARG